MGFCCLLPCQAYRGLRIKAILRLRIYLADTGFTLSMLQLLNLAWISMSLLVNKFWHFQYL